MKGPRGRHVLGVLGREEVSVEGVGLGVAKVAAEVRSSCVLQVFTV